jgi:lysophospholipase II
MTTSKGGGDGSTAEGALIFLHGLGESPAVWSMVQNQLPLLQPRLSKIKYIFPTAPIIPLSIYENMQTTGWFDLYEWPIKIGDPDDKINQLKAIQQIETIVQELEINDGLSRNQIVIGGFSQGGATALLSAYYAQTSSSSSSSAFAGCVVLSGWLTLISDFQQQGIPKLQQQIPLFWGHGTSDDNVLYDQQNYGIDTLQKLGVQFIEHVSFDMGHESHPDEMKRFATFVDDVLFNPNTNDPPKNNDEE